jgi:hypothetical protein
MSALEFDLSRLGQVFFKGPCPAHLGFSSEMKVIWTANRVYLPDDIERNGHSFTEIMSNFFLPHWHFSFVQQELLKDTPVLERISAIVLITGFSVCLVTERKEPDGMPQVQIFLGDKDSYRRSAVYLYQIGCRFYLLDHVKPFVSTIESAKPFGLNFDAPISIGDPMKNVSDMLCKLLERQKGFANCVCRDMETQLEESLPLDFMLGITRVESLLDSKIYWILKRRQLKLFDN